MGPPISKLSKDLLAPIMPPFMPPAAFELVHIERPKFERPSAEALQRIHSSGKLLPAPVRGLPIVPAERPRARPSPHPPAKARGLTISRHHRRAIASDESATDNNSSLSELSADEAGYRLRRFLEARGLQRFTDILEEQEIDMDAFLTLTSKDLQELGLWRTLSTASIFRDRERAREKEGRNRCA